MTFKFLKCIRAKKYPLNLEIVLMNVYKGELRMMLKWNFNRLMLDRSY